jgi:Protein of unknown function (DUF2905)
MDALRETGKILFVLGIALAGVGALLAFTGKLPFRLGRLPGDIVYQGRNGGFYFPVVTCILLSAVLSVLLWVVNHFRR